MSDDPVKRAIEELQELVRCRCLPAYTVRKLRDPECDCDSAENVKVVVDRIEELEALTEQLEAARRDATEAEAYAAEMEAYAAEMEAKLAKAVEALGAIKLYSGCGDSRRQAIETIAELKGEKP